MLSFYNDAVKCQQKYTCCSFFIYAQLSPVVRFDVYCRPNVNHTADQIIQDFTSELTEINAQPMSPNDLPQSLVTQVYMLIPRKHKLAVYR